MVVGCIVNMFHSSTGGTVRFGKWLNAEGTEAFHRRTMENRRRASEVTRKQVAPMEIFDATVHLGDHCRLYLLFSSSYIPRRVSQSTYENSIGTGRLVIPNFGVSRRQIARGSWLITVACTFFLVLPSKGRPIDPSIQSET